VLIRSQAVFLELKFVAIFNCRRSKNFFLFEPASNSGREVYTPERSARVSYGELKNFLRRQCSAGKNRPEFWLTKKQLASGSSGKT
jgi:hypothetical protein